MITEAHTILETLKPYSIPLLDTKKEANDDITDTISQEVHAALINLLNSRELFKKLNLAQYFETSTKKDLLDLFSVMKPRELYKAELATINGRIYIVDPTSIRGGMAKIFKAYDLHMHRIVAIKTVRRRNVNNLEKMLEKEAKAHANEEHPNIVKVFDFTPSVTQSSISDLKNKAAIIMEYVDGNNLEDLVNYKDSPKPEEFIAIVEQICSALTFLENPRNRRGHDNTQKKQSHLHRDLKPQNILLANNTIKLTDFGISSLVKQKTTGTVSYLSPERVADKKADVRSELFSLTTILYELITKKRFFSDSVSSNSVDEDIKKNIQNLELAHSTEKVPQNDKTYVQSPTLEKYCKTHGLDSIEVVDFFKKAWAKNPDDRYQTIEEYVAALKNAFQQKKDIDVENSLEHSQETSLSRIKKALKGLLKF